jgi:hypothetical protein
MKPRNIFGEHLTTKADIKRKRSYSIKPVITNSNQIFPESVMSDFGTPIKGKGEKPPGNFSKLGEILSENKISHDPVIKFVTNKLISLSDNKMFIHKKADFHFIYNRIMRIGGDKDAVLKRVMDLLKLRSNLSVIQAINLVTKEEVDFLCLL